LSAERLFDDDFLRRLEHLRLVSRHLQPSARRGEHRVRRRGAGMEFADFRPYVAGDDIRHLDWSTYLRLDKLLVRLFDEEGDLSIYLLVDCSRSMVEGDPAKFDTARRVAGALGYIGLHNLDRVSLVCFGESVTEVLHDLRGHSRVWQLFARLQQAEAAGRTRLDRAVRDFFAAPRRRGLVVVVSDFLDPDWQTGLEHLARLRHDVLAVLVTSPLDDPERLPREALLVDVEEGTEHRVQLTADLKRRYREGLEEHRAELLELCGRYDWGLLPAPTDLPIDELVLQVFREGRLLR
jgi:uncharacterized protein (DUF58 family)